MMRAVAKLPKAPPLLIPTAKSTWKNKDNESLVLFRAIRNTQNITAPRFGPGQTVCRLCAEVLCIPKRTKKIPVLASEDHHCEEIAADPRIKEVIEIFDGTIYAIHPTRKGDKQESTESC